jgi:NDP-sugar pyrophosphorylase family protein
MKAMILAAGLGTRLRPLTHDRPKALVQVDGRTLLEIVLARLREFGIRDVIINTHHFAEMLAAYLRTHANFGMRIEISEEPQLLDTGGGLKKAGWFFLEDSRIREEPFILHNVDVISTIDLTRMVEFHRRNGALSTLAVQERKTSRYLLFDKTGHLCGRRSGSDGATELLWHAPQASQLAFCGVHVISPRLFEMMNDEGAFSIVNSYLRLAGEGEKILAFRADEYYWRDLGKPENVAQVAKELKQRPSSR